MEGKMEGYMMDGKVGVKVDDEWMEGRRDK